MAATGRREVNTSDVKIDQKPSIAVEDLADRAPEIVVAENMSDKDYQAELAFMEEPMTIRIDPSNEENAPMSYPVWCNGRGFEVLMNGKWVQIIYAPVNVILVTKRKYVEILAKAKKDAIKTKHEETGSEIINNRVERRTSAMANFSIIRDDNPKGAEWLTELRRRYF